MKLQEEILKIKNEMIDEFDKRVEALKEEEQEFPQVGDYYWLINTAGETNWVRWHGAEIENKRLSFGNVFKTKEEADFALEKLKVEAELRKFSKPFGVGKTNTEFYYGHESGEIMFSSLKTCQMQGSIYFESEEKAQQAIKSVGEQRVKKYLFGVEDLIND